MPDVAVIGAGIAGLSAAYRLEQRGFDVAVLEARSSVGGVIRSEQVDGYLVEHGPNSIQSRTPQIEALVRELGLTDQRIEASDAARMRYIVKDRRPVAAPISPTALFTSSLFGAGAKLRLMREPFVPPGDEIEQESVADFIRRRLGSAFLDYGMNPFVAGIYAGDPERLSVKHTFPSLVELEQKHGSIIKGQMEKRRDSATAAATGPMFSFRDGLESLTAALAAQLTDVRTDAAVRAVEQSGPRWRLDTASDTVEASAVIYAAPLHALKHISLAGDGDFRTLSNVIYPPLSVVYHGLRRQDVRHPLDGFGMLVPEVERDFRILGTLFTSSIFPGRAPEGHVLLTTFVGGMRRPELARQSDDEIFAVVRRDLDVLLGLRSAPSLERRVHWPQAIPQYELGYDAVIGAIDGLEHEMPGWFMAGSYRSGVSVGDSAASGDQIAERCAAFLSSNA